jgi:hypothetical protein
MANFELYYGKDLKNKQQMFWNLVREFGEGIKG